MVFLIDTGMLEDARRLAEMLLNEAVAKGADEIGVGCVFCMYHISGVIKDPALKIKTLSQLILENVSDDA